MMDADGAFRHLPEMGALRDQPAFDMSVLRVIRRRWVELMNAKNREGFRNGRR